ncbi:malto-oligosyltrehalose synthase [Cellulomonas flavigena DSM 20109]|uniref:Malto-oligosyltrehalose synthase n=1 Tax=Cellulomonas flavigena (strain ATCC 482 / DSM 20109 / BCRC 11376 / JCM 18109 / NBRC 3775 / NCIMB 8073 / NRS 134) TaxID=446466 RepID=D5UEH9_CELFN|nr:malto-oligosyltrehalose synthase [Cellulomonas flavigena]ADG74639.1 malto-oligosyltrehalose synthase [Cellulomonas flavigena DSM 20109]
MSDTTVERSLPERRSVRPGHPVPVSTYRVQLGADLTFDDVAARVPYYASLGVTHVYLSPVLAAAPGSTHGYDVVDHDTVSPVLGGEDGLRRLADVAHGAGLGLVLDIVPNHMAVPTPVWHNRALWSVLADGSDSPFAAWFDVDWSAGDGAVLMPVLGDRIGAVLARDELQLAEQDVPGVGTCTVLRYHDHVFPVRAGTEALPLAELVERQHYRLAYWKVADEELNYRRFFDVGTLVAVRVEDPEVFDATHALVLRLLREGVVDGLRIDHPDGLADPAGYLARLREVTDGAWVVVEKILAGAEELPDDWATAGTTGYEALWRVQQAFVDPGGAALLGSVLHRVTGDGSDAFEALEQDAKREVVDGPLYAEVHRLTNLAAEICHDDLRLRDHTWRALEECLVELLVAFDRYRAYVVPGEPAPPTSVAVLTTAAQRARRRLGAEREATMDVLVDLLLGREAGSAGRTRDPRRDELVVRFQQTCGAVMAKGVEDTAFYRWTHLVALCEVGGEPVRFATTPTDLAAWAAQAQASAPLGMTTLSTHDTKRGEDTRARLGVLSELPHEWSALVEDLRRVSASYRGTLLDGRTEYLLWQTLAGTWTDDGPIEEDRLVEYVTKAVREAKSRTTWTAPDAAYEDAVLSTARRARTDPEVLGLLGDWDLRTREAVRAATLGSKLVQLTLPGVADVYQGTEVPFPTLVDPDNRRPVDVDALAARLARLDEGAGPRTLADEKLLVTSRALRVRRDVREAFVGPEAGFVPLGHSSGHAMTYARTAGGEPRVVVVATRLAAAVERLGGWTEHTVALPDGPWHDVLADRAVPGGVRRVADVLDRLPVALLVREGV